MDAAGARRSFQDCTVEYDVTFPLDSTVQNGGAVEVRTFSCASADGCTLKGSFSFAWCSQP